MMSASILISQHWLTTIIGVSMIGWIYVTLPKTEEGLILKFGDDYKRYMQKVPRINFRSLLATNALKMPIGFLGGLPAPSL